MTPNSAEMIDTSDFRALHEPTYQTLTSVNGQMSPPGFSPNSSYATLTPLQPLPPISTMSDKFSYGHSSGISQIQSQGISLCMGVQSPYYDKLPTMGLSPPHNYSSPTNTLSGNGNGLHSPQKSMSPHEYDSAYPTDHRDLLNSGRQIQVRFFPHISHLKPIGWLMNLCFVFVFCRISIAKVLVHNQCLYIHRAEVLAVVQS